MSLTQILVARQSASGEIAAGLFLVDPACLGVKNGFARLFDSVAAYEAELRDDVMQSEEMLATDLDLAAKIIRESAAYADMIGFKMHRDAVRALPLLDEANPDACDLKIPVGGPNGKPFFVAGPYDDSKRVMRRLTRALGPDGFDMIVPIEGEAPFDIGREDMWE